LSEQHRSSNARAYQMRKRADDVAETRQRIVEAAARLHGTIGLAATTISALADEARVTRLTVYRHFPDNETLFAACSTHWASGQRFPDPAAWRRIGDPERRLRVGLADLYRFYRDAEPMLANLHRDAAMIPIALREQNAANDARLRETLLKPFDVRGARRRRVRAVVGHATSFETWRSLCVDHDLSSREAVQAMTALVLATAGSAEPPRTPTTPNRDDRRSRRR
jgi:AcrR family transcriptional regulator